jgi:SAM-dependent methyltransferase
MRLLRKIVRYVPWLEGILRKFRLKGILRKFRDCFFPLSTWNKLPLRIRFLYIRTDRDRDALAMAIAVASAYLPPPDGNVPVRNESGGFLRKLLFLLKKHAPNSTSVLLVNEPKGASTPIQEELSELLSKSVQVTQLEDVMGSKWGPQEFDVDYCVPGCFANVNARFDAILNQAMLEHIVDPVQVLKNLCSLLRTGGVIVLQTVTPAISLHRYPIDTLRFHDDFFLTLGEYTDLVCEETYQIQGSIFAVLKRGK